MFIKNNRRQYFGHQAESGSWYYDRNAEEGVTPPVTRANTDKPWQVTSIGFVYYLLGTGLLWSQFDIVHPEECDTSGARGGRSTQGTTP